MPRGVDMIHEKESIGALAGWGFGGNDDISTSRQISKSFVLRTTVLGVSSRIPCLTFTENKHIF